VQAVAPAFEKKPGLQATHTEAALAPTAVEAEPPLQGVHEGLPAEAE